MMLLVEVIAMLLEEVVAISFIIFSSISGVGK
jgi:hypothetical protein